MSDQTRQHQLRAVFLAALMVISVFGMTVAFTGAAAASGGSILQVEGFALTTTTVTGATATWEPAPSSGSISARIVADGNNGTAADESRVVVQAGDVGVSTLGDLDTMSWDVRNETGYAPHVDVFVDTDGDESADDSLVFEYAKVRPALGCDDTEDYPDGDYNTFADKGPVDATATAWLGSGDPGPCEDHPDTNYTAATLSEWKDGGVIRDGTDGETVSIDANTSVLRFEIEVDGWVTPPTDAYVDNITVNGQRYYGQIRDAEDDADEGDAIEVGDGTYEENVVVDTPGVSLQAGSSPVISGGSVTLAADNTSITGFEITNATDAAVTTMPGYSGYLIEANYLHGNNLAIKFRSDGDFLSVVRENTIEDNDLQVSDGVSKGINTGFGDSGASLHNALIEANTFTGHTEGANSYSIQLIAGDGGHSQVAIVGNSMESTILANAVTDLAVVGNTVDFANDNDSTSALLLGGDVVGAIITENALKNAPRGLGIATFFGGANTGVEVHFNDFENNEVDIFAPDGIDARLNWYGDARADDAAFEGDVLYDPFLTAPQAEVDHEDTQQFGHDLDAPAGQLTAVGTPGSTATTVLEMFDANGDESLDEVDAIYAYDGADDSWDLIGDGEGIEADSTLDALDALIVVTDTDARVVIDLADAGQAMPPGEGEAFEGWNLMAAPQQANVDDAFAAASADPERVVHIQPGPGSQPFGAGDSPVWAANVGGGSGHDVSAYTGYWVYVDQDGTVSGVLPAGVTAQQEDDLLVGAT